MIATRAQFNAISSTGPDAARRLHQTAMRLAYEAMETYMNGSIGAAQGMLRSACRLELDAAAKATDVDQPTRAVLCRSAAVLALQGGATEDAARLANLCLHGSLPIHVEDVFRTLLGRENE